MKALLPLLLALRPAYAVDAGPVVISATRIQSEWRKAPQSVTVIGNEALETGESRPLGEILEGSSGASYLVRTNGFAAAKSGVQMRAWAMGSEIVVAKDGLRLSNDTDGEGFDLSLIDLGSLERVELLRGASSSLYGSGAHAGVINLVSRKPGTEPGTKLRFLGGSSGSEHACLEAEAASGPWALRFSAAQESVPDYSSPDYGVMANSAHHRITGSLLASLQTGARSSLGLSALFGRGWDNGLPGDLAAPAPDDLDLSDERGAAALDWRLGLGHSSELRLAYDWGLKDRQNLRLGARGPARTRVVQQQLSRSHALHLGLTSELKRQRLAFGVEGRRELHDGSGWVQPPSGAGYAAPKLPPASVDNPSVYAQDEAELGEKLRLSIGARGDYFSDVLYESQDMLFRPAQNESSAATGHLGLSYELSPGLSVKASGGNSYVAPNVIQRYTFNPRTGFALLGNPGIGPESGYSADLGLAGNGKGWKAELTGFTSEMQGRLVTGLLVRSGASFKDLNGAFTRPDLLSDPKLMNAPTNKWFYHYNLGVTQVQGFEGMGELEFAPDWFLGASFNAATRMVETGSGAWLDSIPSVSARASLEKRRGRVEGALIARYGGAYGTVSRTRPGSPLVTKPEYCVFDLSIRCKLGPGLTWITIANNLLDSAWQQTLDVPEPGIEGRAGIELSI